MQDGEVRREVAQRVRLRTDEHVAREQAVPRAFGDHADVQPMLGVRAGVEILHEDVAVLEIGGGQRAQMREGGLVRRAVHRAPPDVVAARRLVDDELVVGRAAGVGARLHGERAALRDGAQAAADRLLVERFRPEVPVHPPVVDEAVPVETRARTRGETGVVGRDGAVACGRQCFLPSLQRRAFCRRRRLPCAEAVRGDRRALAACPGSSSPSARITSQNPWAGVARRAYARTFASLPPLIAG